MTFKRIIIGTVALLCCMYTSVMAANFSIDDPANSIKNPAEKMYNPATRINNPASNIYNPADQLDNPSPLSPPAQPVPQAVVAKEIPVPVSDERLQKKPLTQDVAKIHQKNYYFKSVKTYVNAAKRAFNHKDHMEVIFVTEDALRRIQAGTLRASDKSKQTLVAYKAFGYGMLEKAGK